MQVTRYAIAKMGRPPVVREDPVIGHDQDKPVIEYASGQFRWRRVLDIGSSFWEALRYQEDGQLHSRYVDICAWEQASESVVLSGCYRMRTRNGKGPGPILRESDPNRIWVMRDLMVDLIIYPDGQWLIDDLVEAGEMGRRGIASAADLALTIRHLGGALDHYGADLTGWLPKAVRPQLPDLTSHVVRGKIYRYSHSRITRRGVRTEERADHLIGTSKSGYPIVAIGSDRQRIIDRGKPFMLERLTANGALLAHVLTIGCWHWTAGGRDVSLEDLGIKVIVLADGRWWIDGLKPDIDLKHRGAQRQLSLALENLGRTLTALTGGEILSTDGKPIRAQGLCFKREARCLPKAATG